MDPVRVGLLGAGAVAQVAHLPAYRRLRNARLIAICDNEAPKRRALRERTGVKHAVSSIDELLAIDEVDAVDVCLPTHLHRDAVVQCLEAGKHVLCEKPLAMNAAEAEEILAAARASGRFLMEAFMYRCSAQTRRIVEIVRSGAIGEVRVISAHFCFDGGANPEGRLLRKELGGGGILDVGCYPASFCRLIAGAATGSAFAEPEDIAAIGRFGPTGVDEITHAIARFPGGIQARLSCGVRLEAELRATVYGTTGRLVVNTPWNPAPTGGATTLQLFHNTDRPTITRIEEIQVPSDGHLYGVEADVVGDAILAGRTEAEPPAMTWDDSLGNMRLLDRWRAAIGLRYDADAP
ncbi:MAG TPA: Gfo/Idh/MocA family oxidoreductase [Gemmatimonadota bacterium]|nr:Gfo/Idh/MocA family oxidoreductase [Gemmatimonadota bacterium]